MRSQSIALISSLSSPSQPDRAQAPSTDLQPCGPQRPCRRAQPQAARRSTYTGIQAAAALYNSPMWLAGPRQTIKAAQARSSVFLAMLPFVGTCSRPLLLAAAMLVATACTGNTLSRGPLLALPIRLHGQLTAEEAAVLRRVVDGALAAYPPSLRLSFQDKLASGSPACSSPDCLKALATRSGATWILDCTVERRTLFYVPDPQATLPTHTSDGNRHPPVQPETLGTWQLRTRLVHVRSAKLDVQQESTCMDCSATRAAERLGALLDSVTARVPAE